MDQPTFFDEEAKFAERAYTLINLLILWVDYCDQQDIHTGKIIGKRYANLKEEKQGFDRLEGFLRQNLMEKCGWTRFDFNDLFKIIPPGFETDWKQRKDLLEDLKAWSVKEFGEYVIPF